MSKKLAVAIVALIALFGVGALVTPVAKADITSDVKDDLKGLLDDLKECIKDFKVSVKTNLSDNARDALADIATAKPKIDDNATNTPTPVADLNSAKTDIGNAVTGIETIEDDKAECETTLEEMVEAILEAQAEEGIDSTEADALLSDINALLEDLATKNDKLLDAELFLEDADDALDDAIAQDINTDGTSSSSPPTSGADNDIGDTNTANEDNANEDVRAALKAIRNAEKALQKVLKIEKQILDNIKGVRKKIGAMKRLVITAPTKIEELGAGVALSSERSGATFRVQGAGVSGFQVRVYSLTGKLVFDSGMVYSPALRWNYLSNDGQPLANGVYLYTVTVQGADGIYRSELKKLAVLR